jgi:hypothetical protein
MNYLWLCVGWRNLLLGFSWNHTPLEVAGLESYRWPYSHVWQLVLVVGLRPSLSSAWPLSLQQALCGHRAPWGQAEVAILPSQVQTPGLHALVLPSHLLAKASLWQLRLKRAWKQTPPVDGVEQKSSWHGLRANRWSHTGLRNAALCLSWSCHQPMYFWNSYLHTAWCNHFWKSACNTW